MGQHDLVKQTHDTLLRVMRKILDKYPEFYDAEVYDDLAEVCDRLSGWCCEHCDRLSGEGGDQSQLGPAMCPHCGKNTNKCPTPKLEP